MDTLPLYGEMIIERGRKEGMKEVGRKGKEWIEHKEDTSSPVKGCEYTSQIYVQNLYARCQKLLSKIAYLPVSTC